MPFVMSLFDSKLKEEVTVEERAVIVDESVEKIALPQVEERETVETESTTVSLFLLVTYLI